VTDGNEDRNPPLDDELSPVEAEDSVAIPEEVRERAAELTRHARTTGEEAAADRYRRERASLLDAYGYTSRVRDADDTLVLHPGDWLEDGTVRLDRIDDTDAAVEIPLAGSSDDWAAVEAHNRRVVEAVAAEHGGAHAGAVSALADYAGNHHERRIEDLTAIQLDRFRTEYVPRNTWLTDEQRAVLEEAVTIAREIAADLAETGTGS
jgi:hypothetical protein